MVTYYVSKNKKLFNKVYVSRNEKDFYELRIVDEKRTFGNKVDLNLKDLITLEVISINSKTRMFDNIDFETEENFLKANNEVLKMAYIKANTEDIIKIKTYRNIGKIINGIKDRRSIEMNHSMIAKDYINSNVYLTESTSIKAGELENEENIYIYSIDEDVGTKLLDEAKEAIKNKNLKTIRNFFSRLDIQYFFNVSNDVNISEKMFIYLMYYELGIKSSKEAILVAKSRETNTVFLDVLIDVIKMSNHLTNDFIEGVCDSPFIYYTLINKAYINADNYKKEHLNSYVAKADETLYLDLCFSDSVNFVFKDFILSKQILPGTLLNKKFIKDKSLKKEDQYLIMNKVKESLLLYREKVLQPGSMDKSIIENSLLFIKEALVEGLYVPDISEVLQVSESIENKKIDLTQEDIEDIVGEDLRDLIINGNNKPNKIKTFLQAKDLLDLVFKLSIGEEENLNYAKKLSVYPLIKDELKFCQM